MKEFASTSLGPSCGAENLDLCSEEQLVIVNAALALTADEVEAYITEKTEAMAAAEQYTKDEIQKLQDRYTELSTEKDEKIKEAGKNLALYRSVKAGKTAAGHDEL
jgi:hypothetical protein